MKKIMFVLMVAIFLTTFTAVTPQAWGNGCSGSIWTTDMNDGPQDKNHYNVNEGIYLNADGVTASSSLAWMIEGLGNQPHVVIASGTVNSNAQGKINAALIYTTQTGEAGHEFKVTLTYGNCNKSDNYNVDEPAVPEFGLIAGGLAITGAGVGYLFLRREN